MGTVRSFITWAERHQEELAVTCCSRLNLKFPLKAWLPADGFGGSDWIMRVRTPSRINPLMDL
jgi:hypothetical protein